MRKNWIAVACAEHVRVGVGGGFMQVCHGKAGPLKRIKPNDRVIYYSPTEVMGGGERLQAFTAIGVVKAGEPYQVQMAENFFPFRRDVCWSEAKSALIRPLLNQLAFTQGKANWGYAFRFGIFQISENDFDVIAVQMDLDC